MKLKLKINESTTDSELVHLGMFFTALGMNRGAHVVSAPTDEAELEDPDEPEVQATTIEVPEVPVIQPEAPKRRRRSMKEHAAEAAAIAAAEAGKDHPAPTQTAPETTTPAEEPASTQSATESPSDTKTYTPAEVQKIAAAEDAAKAEAGKGDPVSTHSVEPQDTPPSETASKEPATESPSDGKTYTPAEVQKIAVATAGRFGPEKVKEIIAQYPGAARIADLPLTELAGFVAKLNAVS